MGAKLAHGLLMLVSKGTQNGVRHDTGAITAMHAMQQDVPSFLNQATPSIAISHGSPKVVNP